MNPIYHTSKAGRELLCAALIAVSGALVGSAGAEENYEGGRGLLTLEGPSGMFINPTSATLPKDAGTLQYCVFFPNNKTDVVGHGLVGSYGLSDEFELGAQSTLVDTDGGRTVSPPGRWRGIG